MECGERGWFPELLSLRLAWEALVDCGNRLESQKPVTDEEAVEEAARECVSC